MDNSARLIKRVADWPVVVMAIGVAVLLGRTVSGRLSYPYDLEWMEGGMLAHGARVAAGEALYVLPSADFIPFIYPPLYPWLLGALSTLGWPLDYPLGRGISLVGVVVATAALVLALRTEKVGWGLALGGGALFLSTYDSSGAFFDLVRNDGLLIGLIATAMLAVRTGWLRVGGVLLTAAFLTKHTAALYGLVALWWLVQHHGWVAARRFCLFSVGPALGFTVGLTWASGGLFLTYILEVPSSHPFVAERFFLTAPKELVMAMPFTAAAAGLVAVVARRAVNAGHRFWLAVGLMAIFLSALMRGHHGGYLNVLIPGLWAMALWSVLAIDHLRTRWAHAGVFMMTAGLVCWQLWDGRWEMNRYLPTEDDRSAGDRIVAQLSGIDGPVLAPWQPWMPVAAGKSPSIALIALWDIDHKGGPLYEEAQVVANSIAAQRWGAVMTAKGKLKRGLSKHYGMTQFERPKGRVFYPKTGWRVRPHRLWVPKKD